MREAAKADENDRLACAKIVVGGEQLAPPFSSAAHQPEENLLHPLSLEVDLIIREARRAVYIDRVEQLRDAALRVVGIERVKGQFESLLDRKRPSRDLRPGLAPGQ